MEPNETYDADYIAYLLEVWPTQHEDLPDILDATVINQNANSQRF